MHNGQGIAERHAHVIRKFEWRGACAALATIYRDEIRINARLADGPANVFELFRIAEAQLEPNGPSARQLAHLLNEVEHALRIFECPVKRRRIDAGMGLYFPNGGNFRRVFLGRQDAPVAGFGALRQLEFDHFDLSGRHRFAEEFGRKAAIIGPTTEITRADLVNEVAAAFQMVRADAALSGVVRKTAHLCAVVERLHGSLAERTVAHGADVEHAQIVRLRALRPAHAYTGVVVEFVEILGMDAVGHPLVAFGVHVELGAKRSGIHLFFGALVHQRALVAVDGRTVGVRLNEVLVYFRPHPVGYVAAVPDQRKVAEDGVACLHHVAQTNINQRPYK